MNWQPINTAPPNTTFLVTGEGCFAVAELSCGSTLLPADGLVPSYDQGCSIEFDFVPTHWAHITSSPTD